MKIEIRDVSRFYLLIVLFVLPFLDTFGLLVNNYFPFLVLFRGLSFALILMVVFTSNKLSKSIKITLALLSIYLFFFLLIHLILFQESSLSEIPGLLKFLYFPYMFFGLYSLFASGLLTFRSLENVVYKYGILIILSILIGRVTGFGGDIVGRGSGIQASKGFMIGANEVGLMMILTAPTVIKRIEFFQLRALPKTAATALLLLSGITVFTKSSLISIFVSLWAFIKESKVLNWFWKRLVQLSFLCGFLFGLVKVLKNLDEIRTFFASTFFNSILEGQFLSFFFRGRQDYISAIYPQLEESMSNFLIFLFGTGEYYIRHISEAPLGLKEGAGTLFEMDFFDILAMHGIIGLVLYLIILFQIVRVSKIIQNKEYTILLFFVFLHSFLAGHVVFSPQVTSLIAFILVSNLFSKSNEKENFDCIRNKA